MSFKAWSKEAHVKPIRRETGYSFETHAEMGRISLITKFRAQGKAFPIDDAIDPKTGRRRG